MFLTANCWDFSPTQQVAYRNWFIFQWC